MRMVRTIATILVSGSFLFTSHGSTTALVLCMGMDGHVEVEAAIDGNCASDSDPHTTGQRDQEAVCSVEHDQQHCGPCIDVPIDLGHADKCHPVTPVAKSDLKVSKTVTTLYVPAANMATAPIGFASLSPESIPPSISSIRTVSLRI